jgi:hypothetical protein
MLEYRLRKVSPEYSEELIQHHLSQIEEMTEEVKKELIENLKKQYEANKEHYDQKLLDL